MTKKIMKSIIGATVCVAVLCIVMIIGFLNDYFSDRVKYELRIETQMISKAYTISGKEYFDGTKFKDTRITWIDKDGTVLYDSVKDASMLENHSDRLEVKDALKYGYGSSQRYSSTLMQKTIYYAAKMNDGTIIRVSSAHMSVWAQILSLLQPILVVLASVIIVSAFIADMLSKKITKPINEIDLENPDIDESYSELSPLLHKIQKQHSKIEFQMQQLRQSREQFNLITENMNEGLIIADKDAFILSCNSGAAKLLDAPKNSDQHRSIFTLNRNETFVRCINEASNGRHCEGNFELNNKMYRIIANPTFSDSDGNAQLMGMVIFIFDETENYQLEAMRREFTSNVSHELRTPLTTIYGVSEMLAGGMVKFEDVRKFGENIHSEAGRMISLISDILALSRLDEGNLPEDNSSIDLYDKVKEIIERLSMTAKEKNITFELSGEHTKFVGNDTVITEVIFNLCDNAIKYNVDNGNVKISVWLKNSNAVISVADSGIGIPASHIDRIFERFYRVDKSHSRKIKGTGLGLSIVKHGVRYLGGTVTAESSVGKGSTFTVTLPCNHQ